MQILRLECGYTERMVLDVASAVMTERLMAYFDMTSFQLRIGLRFY